MGHAYAKAGKGRRTRQYNPEVLDGEHLSFAEMARYPVGTQFRYGGMIWQVKRDRKGKSTVVRVSKVKGGLRKGEKLNAPKSKPKGAVNLTQWVLAVMSMHGQSNAMSKRDAIEMVHATPQHMRDEFNREIWNRRRARGTDKTGGEVPF